MPETDWRERLSKIEEATLVNVSLMDRIEQKVDNHEDRLRAHDEWLAELRAAQSKTEQSLQTLSASMNALFERMDRFIRGLESNGRNK